jgi:sirohydrochlorin cobaltochelatase
MKPPIVMAAFGTTTRAMSTYAVIHQRCKARFPDHPIRWAYSSRQVVARAKADKRAVLSPADLLQSLEQEGHDWAVVQSLHLLCGHEFHRLTEAISRLRIRCSVGLPLLHSPADYHRLARVIAEEYPDPGNQALVLVGHGTDHPIWCAYPALEAVLRRHLGDRVFLGVVEHGPAEPESVAGAVKAAGFQSARLIPLLLVAGVHFHEDLCGDDPDSWKAVFASQGIAVQAEERGLGRYPGVVDIFCDHIDQALDLVPV